MSGLLTKSRLKVARRCLRLHHFEFELGVRPVDEGEAIRFGVLWHEVLEGWWLATAAGLRGLDRFHAARAKLEKVDDRSLERVWAEELLLGYDARWGGGGAPGTNGILDVLEVEREFEAPLINPATGRPSRTWRLSGKLDGVLRVATLGGRSMTVTLEAKTSSRDIQLGSDWWRRLRMDSEVGVYWTGAESLGYTVSGSLYDVVKRPGLRPYRATPESKRRYRQRRRGEEGWGERDPRLLYASQRAEDEPLVDYRLRLREDIAENPDSYFVRDVVTRTDAEFADHAADLWTTAKMLREAQLTGRAPRNPDGCERWGRLCSFFDVCTIGADLDDPSRFKVSGPHPELGGSDHE